MSVSKRIRFEVFKRDKFTCQYCGKSAPDVILEVDHIDPKSKGGKDDIMNLVTSCYDCNRGKSNIILSDGAAVKKRKAQLDELQERREQIEMMMEWHKSLIDIDKLVITEFGNIWTSLVPEYNINEHGLSQVKLWVRKFGINEVIESLKISVEQYLLLIEDGDEYKISVQKTFESIPKICNFRKLSKDKPYMRDLYYIRGILGNRCNVDKKDWRCIKLMEDAVLNGVLIEDIKNAALNSISWYEFKKSLEGLQGGSNG